MKNRLTFTNVINILLENKKKTYPQHLLVRNLFSAYLDDELKSNELYAEDNTMYSRWCNGARPIPLDIIRCYDEENLWDVMENDFRDKILPNMMNESHAQSQMKDLIADSIDTIGQQKANEMITITDNAVFFTAVIRYAILNDHNTGKFYSPDLTDTLLGGRLPSCTMHFIGRKTEIKTAASMLQNNPLLFVTGIAGIGKSEFAKAYADKNKKKYTNIIYFHYTGDLRKDIAGLVFAEDKAGMSETELFESHYRYLQRLHSDSLLIIDNFNVLPKDDPFFKELIKNDFQLIITTRCKITGFPILELKELDKEKELPELFVRCCPSAKSESDVIRKIIEEVKCHTLTVCMAALTLEASGMEADELLSELKSCGFNLKSNDEIEIYKDEEYSNACMIEHLRRLLQLSHLSQIHTAILCNLSLLPLSGIGKVTFRRWLALGNADEINHLVRYGFITEDTENRKISLHPLIQEIVMTETMPSVCRCKTMVDSLHLLCLAHGIDVIKPFDVIESLKSVNEHIINDMPEYYLLFLQDMFPYFEKYGITDYLSDLIGRIEYVMNTDCVIGVCDKALLLDYKAEILIPKKEYDNAVKKQLKAIALLEDYHKQEVTERSANLLSNVYNNLSNVYLLMKKTDEAVAALKQAFDVRRQYAEYGLLERHDTLQQTINLANLLTQANQYEQALSLIQMCEDTVVNQIGKDNFDYGICKYSKGIIAYYQGNTVLAESLLLNAEKIFESLTTDDSDYLRSTRQYLYRLYSRQGNMELTEKYRALIY